MKTEPETNTSYVRKPTRDAVLLLLAAVTWGLSAWGAGPVPGKGGEVLARRTPSPSAYAMLPYLKDLPELAPCLAAADMLPKQLFRVPTQDQGGNWLRLAVHEWGSGTNSVVVVLIHGILSDHRVWRPLAGTLDRAYDLWLVDLPGLGESDSPDPGGAGALKYSPEAMGERIWQALEARLATRNPQPRILLVGHSLGGLVVVRMLGAPDLRERHDAVLRQVSGAVLLSPCDVALNQALPDFNTIAKLNGVKTSLASGLGILRRKVAETVEDSYQTPGRASKDIADMGLHSLKDRRHRRATSAMLREAAAFDPQLRPHWAPRHRMEAECFRITEPCLIVYGDSDETLPNAMGFKLASYLPNSQLRILERCMHTPQIEHPWACAALIRDFERSGAGGNRPAPLGLQAGQMHRPEFALVNPDDFREELVPLRAAWLKEVLGTQGTNVLSQTNP